jgi:hypothetical protein
VDVPGLLGGSGPLGFVVCLVFVCAFVCLFVVCVFVCLCVRLLVCVCVCVCEFVCLFGIQMIFLIPRGLPQTPRNPP